MISLSTRTKEAIKTGLAMTIAYGIALYMNWEKPYWAGFAVAFISLATVGQSLNKAALRMLGTFVAAVVALTFIALFAQDRWLFMLFLSGYVGFCTYMMSGSKHQYFWFVCGFVCVLICMNAGPNSVKAFETALLRTEETGLGILVYSLVSILLWPTSSGADFKAAAIKLALTQTHLYRAYLALVNGEGDPGEAPDLRAQEIQELTRFDQLLDAAESDSYEVWELREPWRRYQRQTAELAENLERWRESFAEVKALDLSRLLPNLSAFGAELDLRFAQIESMLANQAPHHHPALIELAVDEVEVRALSHFQKAALAVTRSRMQHLEVLTRSLFDSLSDIKGFGQPGPVANTASPPHAGFLLDPDRLTSAVRIMATLWLVYFAVIYVNDIPGGFGLVSMAGPFGMILATSPQLPVSLLFMPVSVSVLFASLVYIFVMPQLSSFIGLGLVIFAVTFAICYLFADPKQGLGRAFGLAMFVQIASISNVQTYSFLSVTNTALMYSLIFLALAITAHVPFISRPERVFLRLLGRFFRSCKYLMSTMHLDSQRPMTRMDRLKKAFHAFEISTLPRKFETWTPHIDTKALPGTSPQQVQTVVTSLQGLTYRMQELLEERRDPQAQSLVHALHTDLRAWRLRMQETFQRLSKNPAAGEREAFRSRLDGILDQLEERIEGALNKAPEGQLSAWDGENFYRLLGASRGVSEALINYAGSTDTIDWAQWKEARF